MLEDLRRLGLSHLGREVTICLQTCRTLLRRPHDRFDVGVELYGVILLVVVGSVKLGPGWRGTVPPSLENMAVRPLQVKDVWINKSWVEEFHSWPHH